MKNEEKANNKHEGTGKRNVTRRMAMRAGSQSRRECGDAVNRRLLVFGAGATLLVGLFALVRCRPLLALGAPLIGYAPWWLRGRAANLFYSLAAGFKMPWLTGSGRQDSELRRCEAESAQAKRMRTRCKALSTNAARDVRRIPREAIPDTTIALIADPYRYIGRRCRQYGTDLFETRLFLRRTICMTGSHAAEVFYDRDRFTREGTAPLRLQLTLFGRGGVQGLDGEAHHHRKQMFLELMNPESIARLVKMTRWEWKAAAERWSRMNEAVLYQESQDVMARAVCKWAGVPVDESEVEERTQQISALFDAAGSIGPRYLWAILARRKCDRWIEGLVKQHRARNREFPVDSPARRIAEHRDLEGIPLEPHVAAVEILNLLRPIVAVAVYVVFCAHALHAHRDMQIRLADGDEGFLDLFVEEVRRYYPFFPAVIAKVRRGFKWRDYLFPEGRRVILDLYGTNHDARNWRNPDWFNPNRFAENVPTPFNLIAQGGGSHQLNHRCAGEWITIDLMKDAVRFLTREVRYEIPRQDLGINYARLPALPRSYIRLTNVTLVG